jgi:hypothetical protein
MSRIESAFYARTGGRMADYRTLLHPPYTAWNMSYAAIGAALAPSVDWTILSCTLLAFFLGTGIASHALDELNGRPLKTRISDRELLAIGVGALACCFVLAAIGSYLVSPWIMALAVLGSLLVVAYALEWADGLVHTDLGFALSWGGFPVLVGYFAQTETVSPAAVLVAAGAVLYSLAQRSLSTPARYVRRSTRDAKVLLETPDGAEEWDIARLLGTWEKTLAIMSWSIVLIAMGMLSMHG